MGDIAVVTRAPAPSVVVRRSADRATTTAPGLVSRHCFAFGAHHEPGNTHHGVLLAHNDDVLDPGAGYDTHVHRDVEIVTWVLAGALVHHADARDDVVGPGAVQCLSAGSGLEHTERQHGPEPLRVLQAWLPPDEAGVRPAHARRDVTAALAGGGFVVVASGRPDDDGGPGLPIGVASAAMHVARPPAGRVLDLPDAPYRHVFLARGAAELAGTALAAGDAARLTGTGPQRLTATTDAEVVVWAMRESLTG